MDSLQQELTVADAVQNDDVKTKALTQLNQSTLGGLEKITKDDPTVDLWPYLREAARQYKAERDRCVEGPKIASEEPVQDENNYPKHLLPTQGHVNVCWPLVTSVAKLLQVHSPSPGEDSQDTQPNLVSRPALLDLIQRGEWIFQEFQRAVVRIAPDIVVKIGKVDGVTELVNLQHIRTVSPSVPVPDALGMLQIRGIFYVFTTFIPGVPLDRIWKQLTFSKKKKIQQQLNTIFTELRNLPLPSEDGFLGAGDPPFCKDMRRWTRKSSGVIKCEAQFNDFLLSEAHATSDHVDLIRPYFRDDHQIVMTHSDLHKRNIIVSSEYDPTITGVIDWEAGGGYPEYWEYVKAIQTAFAEEQDDWHLFLPDIAIGTFIDEHIKDCMINRMVY